MKDGPNQQDISAAQAYYNGDELEAKVEGVNQRTEVCAIEVWEMVYGKRRGDFDLRRAKEINDILRNTPGWEKYPYPKPFKHYGNQRGFKRKNV